VVQPLEAFTLDASLQILISGVGAYTDAVDQVITDTQLWQSAQQLLADIWIPRKLHEEIANRPVSTRICTSRKGNVPDGCRGRLGASERQL
jgi:hypothetical protein